MRCPWSSTVLFSCPSDWTLIMSRSPWKEFEDVSVLKVLGSQRWSSSASYSPNWLEKDNHVLFYASLYSSNHPVGLLVCLSVCLSVSPLDWASLSLCISEGTFLVKDSRVFNRPLRSSLCLFRSHRSLRSITPKRLLPCGTVEIHEYVFMCKTWSTWIVAFTVVTRNTTWELNGWP